MLHCKNINMWAPMLLLIYGDRPFVKNKILIMRFETITPHNTCE